MARQLDPQCSAFQVAIGVLGRPWNALILGTLQAGPARFGELARKCRGVGAKMLSARLKDLESRGLVRREVEIGPPIRVIYSLTPQGQAFEEVAHAIERWGQELLPGTHGRGSGARSTTRGRRPRKP
jgi:DNA-binding HxlR family transcriptional regulator